MVMVMVMVMVLVMVMVMVTSIRSIFLFSSMAARRLRVTELFSCLQRQESTFLVLKLISVEPSFS